MRLVLATQNCHKLRELRTLLLSLHQYDMLSFANFPTYTPPTSEGTTQREQAIHKATHAAKQLGLYALADDSRLCVPALQDQTLLECGDKAARLALLRNLSALDDVARSAYFTCALAFVSPEGHVLHTAQALCEGVIATQERGSGGFGYDSLFIKHGYHQTFGELHENVRMRISHRAKAIKSLLLHLDKS